MTETERAHAAVNTSPATVPGRSVTGGSTTPDMHGPVHETLNQLFAECERSARRYFERAEADGLDFDIRCAYAGAAARMVRTAALLAGHLTGDSGETCHRVVVERV